MTLHTFKVQLEGRGWHIALQWDGGNEPVRLILTSGGQLLDEMTLPADPDLARALGDALKFASFSLPHRNGPRREEHP